MNREVTPFTTDGDALLAAAEETLVPDVRGDLSPAQFVERKLERLLQRAPLPANRPGLVPNVLSRRVRE